MTLHHFLPDTPLRVATLNLFGSAAQIIALHQRELGRERVLPRRMPDERPLGSARELIALTRPPQTHRLRARAHTDVRVCQTVSPVGCDLVSFPMLPMPVVYLHQPNADGQFRLQ